MSRLLSPVGDPADRTPHAKAHRRRRASRTRPGTRPGTTLSTRLRTALGSVLSAGLAVGLVAVPAATADEPAGDVVVRTDFSDGTWDPWVRSGDVGLEVVDVDGDPALLVSDRSADYEGVESPAGLLLPGTEYELSMRVRLADGGPDSTQVRFVGKPGYPWLGNTAVTADAWTTVTATWTTPEDPSPSVFIGTADVTGVASYDYLVDDLVITTTEPVEPPAQEYEESWDFEDGTLQGWVPRGGGDAGDPTVTVTTDVARSGTHAVLVSDRRSQGDGLGRDMTDVFLPGVTYDISVWVRMGEGVEPDDVTLSVQRGESAFDNVETATGVTSGEWVELTAAYTFPGGDMAFVYVETNYSTGGTGDLLVDDARIATQAPPVVEDLPSLAAHWADHFPVGVAIDQRETVGPSAELTLRHFSQVTAENHMKPEAWYDADGAFRVDPQATAIMDFAAANDLAVYGHVLVWHSQTPDWFFEAADGTPLTDSPADREVLRERMRTHIFAVAEALAAEYGPFGSDTNPLDAWDVVNEVVADSGEHADGLRRSRWFQVLGEEYIDLAFRYADEAFNDVHAADGADRPVTLLINDYNTEQSGKQDRYAALVDRLLDRGVPIDGVGHQFHVNLSMPVAALDAALERFAGTGLVQAVTELDVTTGTPVTQGLLVDQGYYYRDAFRVFADHAEQLHAVTVWGLTDNRSWRNSSGAPLLFDASLRAKPAYLGAIDGDLPPRQRAAFVFAGDLPVTEESLTSDVWDRLPRHDVDGAAQFQARWEPDHLTVLVEVTTGDAVEITLGERTWTVTPDGSDELSAVTAPTGSGWAAVVHVPLDGAARGDVLDADVRVLDGGATHGWNAEGVLGTLTLVEELSYAEAPEAAVVPEVDGEVDDVWADAPVLTTGTVIEGDATGASADVRTLWAGDTLYVLAEVTDPVIDTSASDPWVQDSVEIFLDAGNARNGPYRYDDTQIRISVENAVSFGTGDEAFQAGRLESATSLTDGGYVVEAAISLVDQGGAGTFHGFDVQVNDATDGVRTAVRTWADPTGLGYQSTARWGVLRLVEGEPGEPGEPGERTVVVDPAVRLPDPKPGPAHAPRCGVVAGAHGIPSAATAVLLEVGLATSNGKGSVTVFPAGADADDDAAVTVPVERRGRTVEVGPVPLGDGGAVCWVRDGAARSGVTVDVTGYVVPAS